jgi:tRNA(adenine34) deaminase
MKINEFDREVISNLTGFLKNDKNHLEVPVASALYDNNLNLISQSRNLKEKLTDPFAHAEILCIRKAAEVSTSWNLEGFSLYVTLEPCLMCTGAILESRISRLIFGAFRKKNDQFSSVEILRTFSKSIEIISGVNEEECSQILSTWFKAQR